MASSVDPATYLEDLLGRMADRAQPPARPDGKVYSVDSVTWKATREAEKLHDPAAIPLLKDRIVAQRAVKDKFRRGDSVFVLRKVAKNLKDTTVAPFLVGLLPEEPDTWVLSAMLEALEEVGMPRGLDIAPVLRVTDDKRWQVRTSALRALAAATTQAAEATLITVVSTRSDPYDLCNATRSLASIGTERALAALERLLKATGKGSRDVKASAKGAIAEIQRRAEPPS